MRNVSKLSILSAAVATVVLLSTSRFAAAQDGPGSVGVDDQFWGAPLGYASNYNVTLPAPPPFPTAPNDVGNGGNFNGTEWKLNGPLDKSYWTKVINGTVPNTGFALVPHREVSAGPNTTPTFDGGGYGGNHQIVPITSSVRFTLAGANPGDPNENIEMRFDFASATIYAVDVPDAAYFVGIGDPGSAYIGSGHAGKTRNSSLAFEYLYTPINGGPRPLLLQYGVNPAWAGRAVIGDVTTEFRGYFGEQGKRFDLYVPPVAPDMGAVTYNNFVKDTVWDVAVSGNYSDSGKWTGAYSPNHKFATALFGPSTVARTVSIDVPVTVNNLSFNSTNGYLLNGTQAISLVTGYTGGKVSVAAGSHSVTAPVTVEGPVTIDVAAASSVALTGGVSNGASSGSIEKLGAGSATLGGALTYSGNTTVTAGTLTLSSSLATPAANVSVAAGATLNLNAPHGSWTAWTPNVGDAYNGNPNVANVALNANTLTVNGNVVVGSSAGRSAGAGGAPNAIVLNDLTIPSGGLLDIGDNDLIVNGGAAAYTKIKAYLASGYNFDGSSFGGWDGTTGITSSAAVASAASDGARTLVVLFNTYSGAGAGDFIYSSYNGIPVDGNSVITKFTYFGDTDLNGFVNGDDYTNITSAVGATFTGVDSSGGINGDFNHLGALTDLGLIYTQVTTGIGFQSGGSGGTLGSRSVPEPTALGLVLAGLPVALRRRR